ncbi:hypothetical protein [Cellulomonas sp.]|uniref:hypothetical protein n=1 Tax=Cellulomonas sp. TaxID=40001 RepID=UPI001B15B9EC|nr:hypothetical protein [Cellulomonas sp.]MBO9556618.1 hypothetical protein [Cellulomonas sp.]
MTAQPMVVVGYDPDVAKAHGYAIRFTAEGMPYAVKSGPHLTTGRGATPDNIVTGNCGSSWVFLYDVGALRYSVDTGFGLVSAAVSYSWAANVVGPAYNYTPAWSGALLLKTAWSAQGARSVSLPGTYSAKSSGTAVLATGVICRSQGPVANQAIY